MRRAAASLIIYMNGGTERSDRRSYSSTPNFIREKTDKIIQKVSPYLRNLKPKKIKQFSRFYRRIAVTPYRLIFSYQNQLSKLFYHLPVLEVLYNSSF